MRTGGYLSIILGVNCLLIPRMPSNLVMPALRQPGPFANRLLQFLTSSDTKIDLLSASCTWTRILQARRLHSRESLLQTMRTAMALPS
jgi:hypothetical protein